MNDIQEKLMDSQAKTRQSFDMYRVRFLLVNLVDEVKSVRGLTIIKEISNELDKT